MAIPGPFSIQYGDRVVGSGTNYILHGPYVLDKSFSRLRVTFDVVITAQSIDLMQNRAEALERDFSLRDQDLTINLSQDFSDDARWTYVFGKDILNTTASILKAGNPDVDRGFARAYTCTVEGDLPSLDQDGLREEEINVDFTPGRQAVVTMRGVYTPIDDTQGAVEQYQDEYDERAATNLQAIKQGATFELVDENYQRDRTDQSCMFTRQYVELLANQSAAALDDARIRDHRITFTDLSQHPGDTRQSVYRLRRVIGSYSCSIDIDQQQGGQPLNVRRVFTDVVRPHVIELFRSNFEPRVFAIESLQVTYDETARVMTTSIQFLYQKAEGEAVIEVTQSVAFRETRTLDRTPVHDEGQLAAIIDPGWARLERIWTRVVTVVGAEAPKLRIIETPRTFAAGLMDEAYAGQQGVDQGATAEVTQEGWNITDNSSQVITQWVGDPEFEQMMVSILNETVIEEYTLKPGRRTSTPVQTNPTTPRRPGRTANRGPSQ